MTSVNTYFAPKQTLPLMDIEDIHATIDHLDLPISDYFVIGGANLVLRGIKHATEDVDLLVSDHVFAQLGQVQGAELRQPPKRALAQGADNSTVWIPSTPEMPAPLSATTSLGDGYYPLSFEAHKTDTEMVDGVLCLDLSHVYASKMALRREKDIRDLDRMNWHLNLSTPLPTPISPLTWYS